MKINLKMKAHKKINIQYKWSTSMRYIQNNILNFISNCK